MPENNWLENYIQSIDHRLELLNTKLDMAASQMVTRGYCSSECDVRRNAVDRRYFLGFGGCVVVAVGIMGIVIKFL